MRKAVVMCDHDGVIADSFAAFVTAFVGSCSARGCDEFTSPAQVAALFDGNVYESLARIGMTPDEVKSVLDATAIQLAAQPDVHAFPDVDSLLAGLAERYEVVVVTSNHGMLVRQFLRREGLDACVADVLGAEAGSSKITKIKRVIEQTAAQPIHVFVGDTRGDMIEGAAAGAAPVGAAWGWHDAADLEATGAIYVAANPLDLLAYLLDRTPDANNVETSNEAKGPRRPRQ